MPAAVQSQDSGVFSETSSQMLIKNLSKGKGKGKNRFSSSSETSSATQSGLAETAASTLHIPHILAQIILSIPL